MRLLLALLALQQTPIHLGPGEYRWIPFTVKQTATQVECRFKVTTGKPTVHLELLPMSDFHLFTRGRDHDSLAISPNARSGDLRQTIEERGEYAVVVMNDANAPPADVILEVSTDLNPGPSTISRELTPQRRLTVILVSFALFFVTVAWSGLKLIRAVTHK